MEGLSAPSQGTVQRDERAKLPSLRVHGAHVQRHGRLLLAYRRAKVTLGRRGGRLGKVDRVPLEA